MKDRILSGQYTTLIGTALIALFIGIYMTKQHTSAPNIKQISSFTQATDILATADQNTLVLFDVDDTLIVSASTALRTTAFTDAATGPWLNELFATVFSSTPKPFEFYMSIVLNKEVPWLIETEVVHIIQTLQERGVKVLALTTMSTGPSFAIASVPEWRSQQLKALGIDLSKTSFSDITFTELPEEEGHFPMLYQGILCAAQASKGQVLAAFLDRVSWKPNQVIFFDDNQERITSVAQEMRKRKIPFQGYQYTGASSLPNKIDKEIITLQLNHLVQHEQWLTEDEAREKRSDNATDNRRLKR